MCLHLDLSLVSLHCLPWRTLILPELRLRRWQPRWQVQNKHDRKFRPAALHTSVNKTQNFRISGATPLLSWASNHLSVPLTVNLVDPSSLFCLSFLSSLRLSSPFNCLASSLPPIPRHNYSSSPSLHYPLHPPLFTQSCAYFPHFSLLCVPSEAQSWITVPEADTPHWVSSFSSFNPASSVHVR